MKSRVAMAIGLGLLLIGLLGWRFFVREEVPSQWYERQVFLLNTHVLFNVYGPNPEAAVEAAIAEIQRVEQLISRHVKDSEVNRINEAAGRTIAVSQEVVDLLALGEAWREKSNGAFDLRIGPLLEAWGFGTGREERVPSQAERLAARDLVQAGPIQLGSKRAGLPVTGMHLDLGGIGKGYAIDRAIEVLKKHGITNGMVNTGGSSIMAIGNHPEGRPWRVGLTHPRRDDAFLGVVHLVDGDALSTSGDYQQYFISDGEMYAHILDPRTGEYPREIIAVSVIASNSAEADAISTALFVLGVEAGLEMMSNFPHIRGILITAGGEIVPMGPWNPLPDFKF